MSVLVIHAQTGVRCGTFKDANLAQAWIDSLRVSPEYKQRFYKIVNAVEYWNRYRKESHATR